MITVLYSGNVGIGQDVDTILHAVARLNCNGDLRILIVGNGKRLSFVKELVTQLQLHNAEFREPVPLCHLAELLVTGDIHVSCQKPGTEGLLVPSKIYGTLAAGRPSLFVGPANCELSRIIRESQSGFVIDPGDVEGAMHALSTLAGSATLRQQMGQNARQYYENHFGRQRSVSKIIDILEQAGRPRGIMGAAERPDAHKFRQPGQRVEARSMAGAKPERRPAIAAMLVATVVMLFFGAAYHAMAARLDGPSTAVPIAPDSLAVFPLQMADWTGHDVPMDEDIVRRTDTDAHINRQYSRIGGSESVTLFLGCSFSTFDRTAHRPEVCYPRSGWTLVRDDSVKLPLRDGGSLPCTILKFSRDGLEAEHTTVLHYYIADGQPYGNVSLVTPRLWRLSGGVNYVARVLIAASPRGLPEDSAEEMVSDFAIDSAPFVSRLLENLNNGQNPDGSCNSHGTK